MEEIWRGMGIAQRTFSYLFLTDKCLTLAQTITGPLLIETIFKDNEKKFTLSGLATPIQIGWTYPTQSLPAYGRIGFFISLPRK